MRKVTVAVLVPFLLGACERGSPTEITEVLGLSHGYEDGDPKTEVDCGEDTETAIHYTKVQDMGLDPFAAGTIDGNGCWSYLIIDPTPDLFSDFEAAQMNADSVANGHYTPPTTILGETGCCQLEMQHAAVMTAVTLAAFEQAREACVRGRRFARACIAAVVMFAAADYFMQYSYFALNDCQTANLCKWQITRPLIACDGTRRSAFTLAGSLV